MECYIPPFIDPPIQCLRGRDRFSDLSYADTGGDSDGRDIQEARQRAEEEGEESCAPGKARRPQRNLFPMNNDGDAVPAWFFFDHPVLKGGWHRFPGRDAHTGDVRDCDSFNTAFGLV